MKNRHLLIVMLTLLMPLAMWGQEELTVNADGTFNNPYLPVVGEAINGDGGLFQSEFIIPSAELTAMNGKSVSVMTFYVASPSPNTWGEAQFNVYLKEVNFTTLDAFSGTDGATMVYSGSLDATGSAMDVFFDDIYTYEGGNLLVGFSLTTPGTNGMASFVGKMMEGNTAFIGLQNNPETYTEIPCLPKITFTYSSSAISCYKPRNLNATIGSTTAVLDWNSGNEETSWQLSYSTTSGNPDGGTLVAVTSHPHTLSGLTNETTYYAYVRANCGGGYSDWSSVCSFTPSNSLSLTVNEGGMFDGSLFVPIFSHYTNEGVSSQFIIPAVELADVMNGQITKLTFYNMSPEVSWGNAEFDVYLGEMEASEYSGTAIKPWSEMTEVYSGALSVSNGMMEITLATPYNYGTDNLVVGFDQTIVGTQGDYDSWYGASTSGKKSALFGFGGSYSSDQSVPKTTIHYTQGTPPSCVRPRNLQATVASQEVALTWENGLDETSWEISYSTIEGSPSTGTIASVNTQSYTITGLTNGTTYYAYVRANCGGSYSDWSTVCAFTPTDVVPTVDLTVYNGTYTGSGVPIQSQFTNYGIESQYIIPAASLADAKYGQINSLTFYCNTASVSWGDAASFKVYLGETSLEHFSGTNILSWNDLSEVYSGSLSVSDSTLVVSFTTPYAYEGDNLVVGVRQTANGTSLTGVSWYGVGDWDGNTALYGVFGSYSSNYYLPKTTINYTPGTAPSCPRPKNLTSSETDAHSTKLSWTNGGDETSWILQYATDEGFTQNVVSTTVTTNPYVLADLVSDITYYARVKAHCGEGDESDWSNVCNFTPACPKPTNLFALNVGKASATMTWTNGGDESAWILQYATNNAFTQNVVSIDVMSNPCNITDLTTETTYYARIKADCGNGDESQWSNIYSFTPTTDQIMVNGGAATNNTVPVYGTWVDAFSKSQFIIPATSMGNEMTGASITKMTYYCSATTINWGVAEFDVYFKEVDNTTFSSTTLDWTGMTVVYSGQLAVSNNMMAIELSEPYPYGGGNLLIGIKQTKSGTYSGSYWYGVETDYYSAIGGYENSKALSYQQFLPKTAFTYVKAHCAEPANLTIDNVTSNSAVFSWTAGSEVTNWQVQYKKTSDADWSESITVSTTPSYTFSNLLAATNYQARVRTVCGADDYSDWVTSTVFTTDCDYMSLPYTYGFEDDDAGNIAPACWHFHGSYYPRVDDDPYNYGHAHSGQNCLLIYQNSDNAANYVVFPEINTAETPINTLQMTFWGKRYGNEVYQYTYFDNLYLGVMTDPNDVSTFQYVSGAYTNITNLDEYKFFELYLDNYSGEGTYLAIRYNGSPLYYIDDIEVSVAPTCRQPLDLSANFTSAHEADVQWKTRDLRQCNYQVSYSTTEGFNPGEGTIVDVEFENTLVNAGTPYRDYMLPCLNANTTYYFYVRANCGNGDFSEWSDDYASFTTQEACPAPEDFGAYTVKNTYAILQWHGELDANWEFHYKKTSDEEWITPTNLELLSGEGSELRYRIDNLETNVEYIAQLRRNCGMYSCPAVDDGYSDWATYTFITSEGCQTPSAWMCLTQMGTSAKLEWNQMGEENYWQIRYRLSTENDYPAENIVLTEYMPEANKQQWTVTGLQPNSMYYWQVRAYCDEESQSNWSNERYFFTGGEKITVDKAHPFYEDFEGASGMPAGWMRCNQYNHELDYYYPWSFTLAEEPAWDERPGNHAIYNNSDDFHGSTSVLTPEMHIDENATLVKLSFNDYCDFSQSAISGQLMSYGSMQVMVSTNHGETYDYVWWSYGPKRYWRQHFIDLEEYIGMDIIIRIDYWWAINQPNFDWYVDDVRVQVFDKVGGGNADVTEGEWNSGDFWGGSVPDSGDDVIINANVTIPEGVVAEANQIVINTDTTYVNGDRAMKFGKLTLADGGQLKVNNAVKATVEKNITGYGNDNNAQNGWYFIASPVNESDFAPEEVNNMLSNTYDLYRLNPSNTMWENYRAHNDPNDATPFLTLDNGRGYLYANSNNVSLSFTGEVKPYSLSDNTVSIVPGWNLIGNPFTCDVTIDQPYSTLTEQNNVQSITNGQGAIHPCQSVAVYNDGSSNRDVTFLLPSTSTAPSNQIHIALTEPQTRGIDIDNAIVSFDEGSSLPKFQFGDQNANIYFPQRGKEYAIVSAEAQGELPLNFKATENGTYTITVNPEEVAMNYLHLIDNLTGADVDLLVEPSYTFTAKTNDYASRFKLVFIAQVNEQENDDFAFISNGNIIVSGEGIIQMIDMTGHVVASCNANNRIGIDAFSAGVYVLRLINGSNVKTQKIIIK